MSKSFMANAQNIERKWYVVDATDAILGRLSTGSCFYFKR